MNTPSRSLVLVPPSERTGPWWPAAAGSSRTKSHHRSRRRMNMNMQPLLLLALVASSFPFCNSFPHQASAARMMHLARTPSTPSTRITNTSRSLLSEHACSETRLTSMLHLARQAMLLDLGFENLTPHRKEARHTSKLSTRYKQKNHNHAATTTTTRKLSSSLHGSDQSDYTLYSIDSSTLSSPHKKHKHILGLDLGQTMTRIASQQSETRPTASPSPCPIGDSLNDINIPLQDNHTVTKTTTQSLESYRFNQLSRQHKPERPEIQGKVKSVEEYNTRNLYDRSGAVPESMKLFAAEIHREDRISRNEEIALGEKTQEAVRLNNIYEQLKRKLEREPTNDEWCAASGKINMEALAQAIDDGMSAKNKLVTSNLRMVQSVVNTYLRNGLAAHYNAGDMMQEGILALIRAAEKFEPDRGFKFSTYAMYWIRASVKTSQVAQSKVISLPQRLHDDAKRIRRTQARLYVSLGRTPTTQELALALGMVDNYVDRCLYATNLKTFSMDHGFFNRKKALLKPNDDDSLSSVIADIETESAEEAIVRQDMLRCLQRHLAPEQLLLILLRFGLVGHSPATIAELSILVGQTPDIVRRRIQKGLIQLKEAGVDDEWISFGQELGLDRELLRSPI